MPKPRRLARLSILFYMVAAVAATAGLAPNAVSAEDAMSSRSATSSIVSQTVGGVTTVRVETHAFALAGPGIKGRKDDERLFLHRLVATIEVLGEKGMEGQVGVAAWPLGVPESEPPLYRIKASGRDGRIVDGDLYVIERGLEEIEWQSLYALSDGTKLFDATTPWLRAANDGRWDERRYVALAQVFDDADDAALSDDHAVALLSYVARDRVVSQVLIKAAEVERARFLRSVWDQTVKLGWRGKGTKSTALDGAMPDPKSGRLAVTIAFSPDGATLEIPVRVKGFDLKKAKLSNGLSLEIFPPNLLLGRWTVSDAKPAPWLKEGTDVSATVALFKDKRIDVQSGAVASDTPLSCKSAGYTSALVPPPGLFQGGLAALDAAVEAKALGLSPDETRSVSLSCDTGLYDFHFPTPDTALLAFDNVIFTLSRQP